jgi:hypothetical protein
VSEPGTREPAFTVVIAAFNEEDMVGDAIRSVQKQTRSDWELVLVDDGSEDATARVAGALAAEDPRIRVISQPNAGLSAARNAGIALARTELISFLDADDLWLPPYLERMDRALRAAPDAGWAYTDAWALDIDRNRFRKATAMSSCQPPEELPTDPVEIMKLLVRQNFIWVAATVRRSAMDAAGPFRVELESAEDVDLWFRILAQGYRAIGPIGVLGIKGERPDAMSRQELKMIVSFKHVLSDVAGSSSFPADVRQAARRRIAGLDRRRSALSGKNRSLALALAAQRKAGATRRALFGRYDWTSEPPPEVQRAFPGLGDR